MIENLFSNPDDQSIYEAAVTVLQNRNARSGQGLGLKELIPSIQAQVRSELAGRVYWVILTASKDPRSPIRSGGPWRGYFLADVEPELYTSPTSEAEEEVQVGERKLKESDLYPLVGLWLKRAKKVNGVSSEHANYRGGGLWSNPDVVALDLVSRYGIRELEIYTVEVKPSQSRWRIDFFEAVSHKRFADRAYYIFRTADGVFDPEIYYYAEKFKIGICSIEIPDDKIGSLQQWISLSEASKLEFVDAVTELVPAPLDLVPFREKSKFLEQLGLRHDEELHRFGE